MGNSLAHLSRFWDFCAENRLDQKACYLSIAAYLTHLSSVGQSRTTLSSAKCHLLASFGLYDTPQVSEEDLVRLSHLVKGLRQRDSRQTRHTSPLGVDHIPRMVAATCGEGPLGDGTPFDRLQLATMFLLCHDCVLRSKELMHLQRRDVEWIDASPVRLIIRNRKAHRGAGPRVSSIPADSPTDRFTAVAALRTYWPRLVSFYSTHTIALTDEALLFPRPSNPGLAHTHQFFSRCLREWAVRAGATNPAAFTPHSFRAGGATDMAVGGADAASISLAGGWTSNAVLRYINPAPQIRAAQVSALFETARSSAGRSSGLEEVSATTPTRPRSEISPSVSPWQTCAPLTTAVSQTREEHKQASSARSPPITSATPLQAAALASGGKVSFRPRGSATGGLSELSASPEGGASSSGRALHAPVSLGPASAASLGTLTCAVVPGASQMEQETRDHSPASSASSSSRLPRRVTRRFSGIACVSEERGHSLISEEEVELSSSGLTESASRRGKGGKRKHG